jgi:ADP-heptose:LPS heptosyltransferase
MRILIFHIGSLGDTIVSIPSLWAIREHFFNANITMLTNNLNNKNHVQAKDILDGSGLVDDYISYGAHNSSRGEKLQGRRLIKLLFYLRSRSFNTLVYLIRSRRNWFCVKRDITFFRFAGIKQFIGHKSFEVLPKNVHRHPLPTVLHQADQFLSRVAVSGIDVPPQGKGKMALNVGIREKTVVEQWVNSLPFDGGRRWIALGIGSKMPVKLWPLDRYVKVVSRLIEKYHVWPVIFGSFEDQRAGKILIKECGCGYVAAGSLNIRQSLAALEKCSIYLGNDTGTLHMAVTAGIPCVGIYSSRDYPGKWYPYGDDHIVLRTSIACEGCMLESCVSLKMECILRIDEEQVFCATERLLNKDSKKVLNRVVQARF